MTQPLNNPVTKVAFTKVQGIGVLVMTFQDGTVKTFTFDMECNVFPLVNALKEFGCPVSVDIMMG